MSMDHKNKSWRDHPHYPVMKWLLITACCMIVVALVIQVFTGVSPLSLKQLASYSASEIRGGLYNYAKDHGGKYPDGATANELFRQLIVNGYTREVPFSGYRSAYYADFEIGAPPDFAEALEPGECHWAVMRGMTLNDPGHLALIFENPVDQSWPPVWHTNLPDRNDSDWHGPHMKGRAWRGGHIIIGRNDGSIAVEKLASETGNRAPVKDETLFSHSPDRLLDPPFALPESRASP